MKIPRGLGINVVLAAGSAILAAIGGAHYLGEARRAEGAEAIVQSAHILGSLEAFAADMEAAESAAWRYLVGGSRPDLERQQRAEAGMRAEMARLSAIVAGSADLRRRTAELDAAATEMMSLRQKAAMLREAQGAVAAVGFAAGEVYRTRHRHLEALVETIRGQERKSEAERELRLAEHLWKMGQLSLWSGLMAIVLAILAGVVFNLQQKEQRRTEAHVREQEKRYRLVTGSIPALIGYVDRLHRVQYHNQAAEKWLDLPAQRIDGQHLAQVLGSEAYESILAEIELALAGTRVEYERKRSGRDGREHYIAGTFIPDCDNTGQVMGFFTMIIDVTERKQAEEALRASEERWKFALEGSGDGVWDRNIQTGEVLYSKRYKEMLGFGEDEFENRREEWEKRIHPEDRVRVVAALQAYLDGESLDYAPEFRMQCKDGSWKWILSRGVIVSRDADGSPLRMIGTHSDISARVRQNEEISRINERLDLALQGSRLAIWDADLANGTIYLSEGWADMLGDAPHATFTDAQSLFELVHPEDLEPVRKAVAKALKGASPEYHFEHRVRTHSGGWKWILSHGRVTQRDASGRALRVTGTNADISARKEIERMKSEFVSVVSHELRTPLTSIVGSLGLLVHMADLHERAQTLIRVAQDNSQRLVRLINDILDVEKLDSDTVQIRLEPVELVALLQAAIRSNQGYAQQYGANLTLAQSDGPAWVRANSDRLMQVMANLLSNAIKFSPRGAHIEIRLERLRDAFRVSVIDPGPGIPEEFKPRVFARFAQADSSNSRQKGGTGLGLAICKMIIDKLGGEIDFVSVPGHGTTFFFDLDVHAHAPREYAGEHKVAGSS
jgi:PAS domain S-box-containing protein